MAHYSPNALDTFLENAEYQAEQRVHSVRCIIHAVSFALVVAARLSIGPQLDLMFYSNLWGMPVLFVLDWVVYRMLIRGGYRPWIKYLASAMDLVFATSMIYIVRTMLDRSVFPLSIQVPAVAMLFLLAVLSGFRFHRRFTVYAGSAIFLVMVSLLVYDIMHKQPFTMVDFFSHLTMLSALVATVFVSAFISGRARAMVLENYNHMKATQHVTQVFGTYVNPEVAQQALEGNLELGGEERQLAVLFCDIRDFTGLSEQLSPSVLVALLNDFFGYMTAPVREQGGVVDKIIGDCVMALFGVPLPVTDYRERALRAAMGMRDNLEQFNQKAAKRSWPRLRIGIGIASGTAVVGNVGTRERMQYTAIGDTVNIASRIEGLCRERGQTILVDEKTAHGLEEAFSLQYLAAADLKGKKNTVAVYCMPDRKRDQA